MGAMHRVPRPSGPVFVTWVALALGAFVGGCGTPTFDVFTGDAGEDGTPSHGPDSGLSRDSGTPAQDTGTSPHDAGTLRAARLPPRDDASPVLPDSGHKDRDGGAVTCAVACTSGGAKCANGPDGCEMSCVEGCCVFNSDTTGKACTLATGAGAGVCDDKGNCFKCVPGFTGDCASKTCQTAVCTSDVCAYVDDEAGTRCSTTVIADGMCGPNGNCEVL